MFKCMCECMYVCRYVGTPPPAWHTLPRCPICISGLAARFSKTCRFCTRGSPVLGPRQPPLARPHLICTSMEAHTFSIVLGRPSFRRGPERWRSPITSTGHVWDEVQRTVRREKRSRTRPELEDEEPTPIPRIARSCSDGVLVALRAACWQCRSGYPAPLADDRHWHDIMLCETCYGIANKLCVDCGRRHQLPGWLSCAPCRRRRWARPSFEDDDFGAGTTVELLDMADKALHDSDAQAPACEHQRPSRLELGLRPTSRGRWPLARLFHAACCRTRGYAWFLARVIMNRVANILSGNS